MNKGDSMKEPIGNVSREMENWRNFKNTKTKQAIIRSIREGKSQGKPLPPKLDSLRNKYKKITTYRSRKPWAETTADTSAG